MLIFPIILLLIVSGVAKCSKDDKIDATFQLGESCDVKKLKFCAKAFFDQLQYKGELQDAEEFGSFLRSKYENGLGKKKEDFEIVCKAVNNAESCFGESLLSCLNGTVLKQLDIEPEDALMYQNFFKIQRFICGLGKEALGENWECIEKIKTSQLYEQHRQECYSKYMEDVEKHKDKSVCPIFEEYSSCLSKPFQACNLMVYGIFCQLFLLNASTQLLECQHLECPE